MDKPLRIPYFHGVPIDLCEMAIWMARCQSLEGNLDSEQQQNLLIQDNFTNTAISSSNINATMYANDEWIHIGTKIFKTEPGFNKNSNGSDELMAVCEEIMDIYQNPLPLIEPYRCFPHLSLRMNPHKFFTLLYYIICIVLNNF